jgi:hypothetical protein
MVSMSDNGSAAWPTEVRPILERAITCEYATLTRAGQPITFPMTPYSGEDGRTINVSTGLTYPSKAERARQDPRVALLFSDPVGSGLSRPPVVLVQGLATVRDADLQANTDRYLARTLVKLPDAYRGTPWVILRTMDWYFARIWIAVTPLRILWWPDGQLDAAPHRCEAPAGTSAPPSDPAPRGRALPAWQDAPNDWQPRATHAAAHLGAPVLTVVGEDGYPVPLRSVGASLDTTGFRLTMPQGLPTALRGPASLTFHAHAEAFTGQENATFVGEVTAEGNRTTFRVERVLGDFSLAGSRLRRAWALLANGRRLRPRLAAEAARRGQPIPKMRRPA